MDIIWLTTFTRGVCYQHGHLTRANPQSRHTENLKALYGLTPHRGAVCYLKDDGRQCGLIVSVLISLRLGFLLPVFLIRFQGLA